VTFRQMSISEHVQGNSMIDMTINSNPINRFLHLAVTTMVKVQRAACMRPSEVCRMKVGEIDRSGEVWKYTPRKHNNSWRNHRRTIHLGEIEQAIIAPRLVGKQPNDPVFSPKVALVEKKARDAARRKTKITPSQLKRAERVVKNPKRKVNDSYTTESYGKSIKQAMFECLFDNADIAIDRRSGKPLFDPLFLEKNKRKRGKIIDGFISVVLDQQAKGIAVMIECCCRFFVFEIIPFSSFEEVDGQFLAGNAIFRQGWRQFPAIGKVFGDSPFIFFPTCLTSVFS